MGERRWHRKKLLSLRDTIRGFEQPAADSSKALVICAAAAFIAALSFGYVYFSILRPFDKMKNFAEKIAQGNFDIPLDYERSNYFGSFTWAFDSMRREITKARACEREAIDNNKTVIATLSHDIKTPVASIRAYAEGLGRKSGQLSRKAGNTCPLSCANATRYRSLQTTFSCTRAPIWKS